MKLIVRKIMIWFMWFPLRGLVKFLPIKISYLIGVTGGHLLYLISRDKRKIMAEELNPIFPDKHTNEIRDIIKGSFINYSISELEVLLYPLMNKEFISQMITIEGKEHLDRALSEKRGVLLFQAHYGAFQMVMPAIGYSGYKMNQISASASVWKEESSSGIQKKSFDIKAGYEYTLPVRHIALKSSLRPVFRALEKNEIVGITVDGGGGKKVVTVKFLGRNANFQQGAVDLAIRTGAAIVPAFIITQKGLKHKLIIYPSININETLNKDENIHRILNEFIKILEGYVYRHPTHYGYTLYLRKSRAAHDPYPFFEDHLFINKQHIAQNEGG